MSNENDLSDEVVGNLLEGSRTVDPAVLVRVPCKFLHSMAAEVKRRRAEAPMPVGTNTLEAAITARIAELTHSLLKTETWNNAGAPIEGEIAIVPEPDYGIAGGIRLVEDSVTMPVPESDSILIKQEKLPTDSVKLTIGQITDSADCKQESYW